MGHYTEYELTKIIEKAIAAAVDGNRYKLEKIIREGTYRGLCDYGASWRAFVTLGTLAGLACYAGYKAVQFGPLQHLQMLHHTTHIHIITLYFERGGSCSAKNEQSSSQVGKYRHHRLVRSLQTQQPIC